MTGFLASVISATEADIVLAAGADIIDLKDPRVGALGALPSSAIRDAVRTIAGRRTVSATAGDLPMVPDRVTDAVARIADLGVDIVKVGLFRGGDWLACLDALARQAAAGTRLVAVLFADQAPDIAVLKRLREAGFVGAMLDTADKHGGGLRDHLADTALADFVRRAAGNGLMSGLAGSLKLTDIPPLLTIAPDYLGFRGALCHAGRTSTLAPELVQTVRAAIGHHSSRANIAVAAAGAQRAAHSLV